MLENRQTRTCSKSIRLTLFSLLTSIEARLQSFFILSKSPSSAAHKRAVRTKSSLSFEEKKKRIDFVSCFLFTSARDRPDRFESILSKLTADEMDERRNCD